MSGSTGLNLTPETLLNIYQPEVILWLYAKSDPTKAFLLIFPAHGPVNLPRQLTVEILCEIMLSLMTALADIMRFGAVIRKGGKGA